MENIIITTPKVEDVWGIQNVYYESWLATYPNEQYKITVDDIEDNFKDSFTEETLNKRRQAILNPDPDSKLKVLIAKHDDKVVGVCRVELLPEKNQLRTIYLLPEYFGKGIGTKLWNEIKKFCDPNKPTYVEVVEYNDQAINFYKKLGFVETGKKFSDERFRMKSGSIFPEIEMVLKVKE